MSESAINKFFQEFEECINNSDLLKLQEFYHLPAIVMDKENFIPLSNSEALGVYHGIIQETAMKVQKDKKLTHRINMKSDMAKGLINVDIKWKCGEFSQTVRYGMIYIQNGWRIILTELLDARLPEISFITKNKKDELNDKFYFAYMA